MSRPLRIEYEGAWYHVMNRGRAREAIFAEESDYGVFLDTLGEAVQRYRAEIHAYCLMPNHYHLLIHTPEGNLGRVMRHIDGLYTQRYNRRQERDGSLFRGRYKAILMDADAYLLSVSRYIHRNPVEGRRPLVERLEAWPWSSYPAFVRAARPPDWLTRTATLDMLGTRNRYAAYRRFVEEPIEKDVATFYANQRATPVLGDDAFRDRVLGATPLAAEVACPETRRRRAPAEALAAVAGEFGVEPNSLRDRDARRSGASAVARQMGMRLCRDHTGLTLKEIGEWFGGIHYSAVHQNIRRLQSRLDAHPGWSRSYRAILSRLDL